MKKVLFLLAVLWLVVLPSAAQEAIYRCGNEYTNAKPEAARGCKLVSAGNITVVPAVRAAKAAPAKAGPRVDSGEQKSRDSDARLILLAELKKAQLRQQELQGEYNDGEPEKRAEETRNHQKYLDRVAELKANLARNESDMAGIRRELDRLPPAAGATPGR